MKRIHVVAAVIERGDDILIARRPDHLHQGGKWEFPGGKVEPDEPVADALVRELQEELGIVSTRAEPLITICHDYPDKHVLLDVWKVTAFKDEPRGMEGQEVRWVARNRLPEFDFPAANVPIVAAARLPRCYVITPEVITPDVIAPEVTDALAAWLVQLRSLMSAGQRLFQLRLKQLDAALMDPLLAGVLALKQEYDVTVLVNSDMPLAVQAALDGVHLTGAALMAACERPVTGGWLAASCHSPAELMQAQRLGVDFVTLSPLRPTTSHPEADMIGDARFAEWVKDAKLPVYALGGVGPNDIGLVQSLGAQGVAGIRSFWSGL